MKKRKKCISERAARNTASKFETPAFMYGVPHTLHPKPATLFITSTTELVRTMAEMAVQANRDRLQNEVLHAQHRAEIEEIWRYLRYEPRNGNGRGEG